MMTSVLKFKSSKEMKTKIEDLTIEEGYVMGTVSTNRYGSECTFSVCTVEEYDKMTEDESLKALEQAMWESGYCEISF